MNKPEDTTTIDFDEQDMLGQIKSQMSQLAHEQMVQSLGRQIGTAWMNMFPPEQLLACLNELSDFLNAKEWDARLVTILCAAVTAQNCCNPNMIAPECRDDWDGYMAGVELNSSASGYVQAMQTAGVMAAQPHAPQEFRDRVAGMGNKYGDYDPAKAHQED